MNYVLQFKRPHRPNEEDFEKVRRVEGVRVVDQSAFSLLAEIEPDTLGKVEELLPDWDVSPEVIYTPPTTQKSIKDED